MKYLTSKMQRIAQSFIKNPLIKSFSTKPQDKWDLYCALCLERKPVLAPPKNEIEEQFSRQLAEIELEKSQKSKHEVRHDNDLKQMEMMKKGDLDSETTILQTAQDFADASVEEFKQFKAGAADSKANEKSLNRKLDRHLVLLLEQKIGDKKHYLLPQLQHNEGENLRQTSDRILRDSIGSNVKAQIYGNAPVGFYKYRYPKSVKNSDTVGAKVFIYFARHLNGNLPENANYKWLDREELVSHLPEKFSKSLSQMLIDE